MAKERPTYTVRLLQDAPGKNDSIIAAGTVIEGPQAYRLVQMGIAEPVCDLSRTRAESDAVVKATTKLTEEQRRKTARVDARKRLEAKRDADRAAFERMLHGETASPAVAETVTDIEPATKTRPGKGLAKRKTETLS